MVNMNDIEGFNGMWNNMVKTYNHNFHEVSNSISATNKGIRSNAQSIKMLRKQLRKSRFGTGLALGGVILLASAVNTLCEKVQELNGKVTKLEAEKHEDDLK